MIEVHERHPSAYPVFILAGGQGERLAPLTEAKPKPAVSFAGTHQIIDFTLSNCLNSEFRKIYVLTQYQREPLHDYVGKTTDFYLANLAARHNMKFATLDERVKHRAAFVLPT